MRHTHMYMPCLTLVGQLTIFGSDSSLVLVKVLHDAVDVLEVARAVGYQQAVRARVVGGLDQDVCASVPYWQVTGQVVSWPARG